MSYNRHGAYMSTGQVADFLGYHRNTVYRWCIEGKLEHVRVGKIIRVRTRSVVELDAELRVAA